MVKNTAPSGGFDPSETASQLMAELWGPGHSIAYEAIADAEYPWQALAQIDELILRFMESQDRRDWHEPVPGVHVHRTAEIDASAKLLGPALIGAGSIVGPHAYIRQNVIIGKTCHVGNTSEVKQAILFDGVQVPHYNYVGDSILGYLAHLGAGAICSNYRSDHQEVSAEIPAAGGGTEKLATGLRKFGCLLGDRAEIGCNSVLNPGMIGGRGIRVYPLTSVRGYIPASHICKSDGSLIKIQE